MKSLCLAIFILVSVNLHAQLNVVPMPAEVMLSGGSYYLAQPIRFVYKKEIKNIESAVGSFKSVLQKQFGIQNVRSSNDKKGSLIKVTLNQSASAEEYSININSQDILITGGEAGIYYAFQTLSQMIKKGNTKTLSLPMGVIKDKPRFGYRGMHLDVARHFFPVDYIKKYIDYLAFHKFNTFHWHLTDDQGWRIEIKKYPKLTEVGSCRAQTLVGRYGSDLYDGKKYCGYYTQAQIKEIIKYSADRFITVIPEIDIPGHTLAALASYPSLGCTKGPYKVSETWGVHPDIICGGNDSSYKFIEGVLDEVINLFPSKYIHIGGDEAPKERWKRCAVCQAKIKTENLKDEHALQSYFIQRVEKFVNSKGRSIIGWDEILEGGLAPNATVMSWRGIKGGVAAATQDHYAIMTPETPLYLNHTQTRNEDSITQGGYNPLELVYNYDPLPSNLADDKKKFILGGQGNVWTEYISNTKKLEYMIFPRMSAVSEILWSTKEVRNWNEFERRLPQLFKLYKSWNANYSNAFYDIQPSVIPHPQGIAWQLESKNKEGTIIYLTGRAHSATRVYDTPLVIRKTGSFGAALTARDHTFMSSWIWQDFKINKASGKKIQLTTLPSAAYAGKGAFTLVDGVQNTQAMVKSAQFLGFPGTDLEAVIDLDSVQLVTEIVLHAFEQQPSWIYKPLNVKFYLSEDGVTFHETTTNFSVHGKKNLTYSVTPVARARYVKVFAKNSGIIPEGMPGAGSKSWLFADEIEIN